MSELQYTELEYRCIRAIAGMVREFQMNIAEKSSTNLSRKTDMTKSQSLVPLTLQELELITDDLGFCLDIKGNYGRHTLLHKLWEYQKLMTKELT